MQEQIENRLSDVQQKVQESFDIDVQEHLRIAKQETGAFLNRYEYIFWELTKYILHNKAEFDDSEYTFSLKTKTAGCKPQRYALFSKQGKGEPYRLSHPLAQYVINSALS